MTEKERMLAGELYCYSSSRELLEGLRRARYLTRLYNATGEEEEEKRQRILRELFASVGESCVIEPDFRCDYGSNIWIGDDFYANFGCVILDVCPVRIGSHVLFLLAGRQRGWQQGAPAVPAGTAGAPCWGGRDQVRGAVRPWLSRRISQWSRPPRKRPRQAMPRYMAHWPGSRPA